MTDVFKLLKADHDRHRKLLAALDDMRGDSPERRELFEALRKAVLELDACVTEEFLKLYVAYKAETNFVDVVPQVRRLRLSLNMPFNEIDDPRGLCVDVTSLGRWGNGDVEVGLPEAIGMEVGVLPHHPGVAVAQEEDAL